LPTSGEDQQRRLDQLIEYRNLIDPIQEHLKAHKNAAVGFAEAAVKAAFLLNGGGLLAIPAFWAMVPNTIAENGEAASQKLIEIQAMIETSELFVCGLIAAAFATILAYANFSIAAAQNTNQITAVVDGLNQKYSPQQGLARAQWSKGWACLYGVGFNTTFVAALLSWVATYAFFYRGARHLLLQFGGP